MQTTTASNTIKSIQPTSQQVKVIYSAFHNMSITPNGDDDLIKEKCNLLNKLTNSGDLTDFKINNKFKLALISEAKYIGDINNWTPIKQHLINKVCNIEPSQGLIAAKLIDGFVGDVPLLKEKYRLVKKIIDDFNFHDFSSDDKPKLSLLIDKMLPLIAEAKYIGGINNWTLIKQHLINKMHDMPPLNTTVSSDIVSNLSLLEEKLKFISQIQEESYIYSDKEKQEILLYIQKADSKEAIESCLMNMMYQANIEIIYGKYLDKINVDVEIKNIIKSNIYMLINSINDQDLLQQIENLLEKSEESFIVAISKKIENQKDIDQLVDNHLTFLDNPVVGDIDNH